MKLPTFENPLKLFNPAAAGPALATAGANGGHMMFSSSGSGGGGGYDDDGYDDDFGYDDDAPDQEPTRSRPQSNRTRRTAGRANADGGRSQTASHQPEARYWTDYLRIALPVIGIILMLGLLWIWASSLLGGDDTDINPTQDDTVAEVQTQPADPNEVNTEAQGANTPVPPADQNTGAGEIPISGQNTGASTPETSTGSNGTFNPTQNQTPASGGDNTSGEETTTEEEPPADTGGEVTVDARVSITEPLNVRPSAGTTGDPIRVAEAGEEGIVISGPEEADGYTWWEVVFDNGSSGFVIQEYLEVIP